VQASAGEMVRATVSSNISLYANIGADGNGGYFGSNGDLRLMPSGTERARIDISGRLLVGTSTASGSALLQVAGDVQVQSINGGPIGGSRNALINGNPTINQRGYVSGTATSGANQYTLDRWRVVTSGQSITWTDSQNVRTVTAPAGGVEQVIEGINLITGTYTLNWTGTATATVAGNSVSKGGNVSITGGTDTTVRFSSGTFSLVQFEPGTVATPFERRSYGAELALCQRYFETSYPAGTAVGAATTVVGIGGISLNAGDLYSSYSPTPFLVTKRASPTINFYAGTTGQGGVLYNNSLGTVQGNAGSRLVSQYGCTLYCSNNAMSSTNAFSVNFTASAEL
jgi:hypothetical protein